MKIATIHIAGRERTGLLIDGQVIDLAEASARLGRTDPFGSVREIIRGGAEALGALHDLQAEIARRPGDFTAFDPAAVQYLPPVPDPSKIICLALNNSANADRVMRGPKHPATFIKPASALAGHGAAVECRPHYGRVHPEPELAVIIGKRAKSVRAADAMDHVFGYTIHNDITSPTMREEDTFHYRAIHPKADAPGEIDYRDTWVSYPGRYKASDTFSPMGPWIVTRDEIPDPHALRIACYHRDELVTEDNTANLFFKLSEVIAFVSSYMTLMPGDIISMGTALKAAAQKGGGAVQNIDLNSLGGPVTVEIEGIGRLTNMVAWPA